MSSATGTGPRLEKSLKPWNLLMIVLGYMSPAVTAFVYVPIMFGLYGGFSWLAMAIGAVIMLPIYLVYAELGSAWPLAGGEYSIVGRALDKGVAFILFVLVMAMLVATAPITGLGAGMAAQAVWSGADPETIAVAVIALGIVLGLLNIRESAWVGTVALVIDIGLVTVVIVLGLLHGHWNDAGNRLFSTDVWGAHGSTTSITFKTAIAATGFAALNYAGFSCAVVFAEESENARRHLGRIMVWVYAAYVGILMLFTTAVFLAAPSLKGTLTSPTPLADLIGELGGGWLNKVVNILLFLVISQATMLFVVFVSRQLWSSGRDKAWPTPISHALGWLHPRFKSPWIATVLFGAISIPLVYVGVGDLVTILVIVLLISYVLMTVSAIAIRIRKNAPEDRWKMPAWQFWVVLGLASMVAVATQQSATPLKIVGIIAAAAAVYYVAYLLPRRATHFRLDSEVEPSAPADVEEPLKS